MCYLKLKYCIYIYLNAGNPWIKRWLFTCWLILPVLASASLVDPNSKELEKAVLEQDWTNVHKILGAVNAETPSPVLRMIKGHADLALNHNNESLSIFVQLTSKDLDKWSSWTNEFSSNNGNSCAALYFSGDAFARGGSLGSAYSQFTKAVETNKNCYMAWNARGVISILRKEYDTSMKDFKKALSVKPDFIDVKNNIAMMRISQGQGRKGAIKRFRAVIKSEPEFSLAHHGLGFLELLTAQNATPQDNKNIIKAITLAPVIQELLLVNEERFEQAYLDKQALLAVKPAQTDEHDVGIQAFFQYPPSLQLAQAAARGNGSRIRRLIDDGAPLDLQGLHGLTPLMWALFNNNLTGVKTLLDAGADPNIMADNGDSAVTIAATLDDHRFLGVLLTYGGNVEQRGADSRTLLMKTSRQGTLASVNVLVKVRVNLDADDSLGLTALHHAAMTDQLLVIQVLLAAGADPTKKDALGLTPYDYAGHRGNQKALALLENKG